MTEVVMKPIDVRKNRFPFSIVWGPLPCLTWLFPFIGHMGICDSQGRVHDFAGPYYIGIDQFMTGPVCKYVQFTKQELANLPRVLRDGTAPTEAWDRSIDEADRDYEQMMHNLCCNNCHHHVARSLQHMGLDYTMLKAWWLVTIRGKYVNCSRVGLTYCGFFIMIAIAVIIIALTRV